MSGASASPERFVVAHDLGRGGMGSVHRAHDNVRGTVVALKRLQRVDPTSLLRFKTEFRSLANLSHRNLVQLYELIQHDEEYLLSMELVDGTDFLAHVRSKGSRHDAVLVGGDTESIPGVATNSPYTAARRDDAKALRQVAQLDEHKLRHALRQLSEGLQALHTYGHLHRDLKPANVLVFHADERLVICDFGLVVENTMQRPKPTPRARNAESHANAGSTATSAEIAGTLAFMSPEQMAGLELTPASDWYSVGAMLYQALTLRVPFDPRLAWSEALAVRQQQLPDHPLTIAPDVPVDLANLAMALLEREPAYRAGYADIISTLEGKAVEVAEHAQTLELVGRESELRVLHEALASTRQGKPAAVLVSGLSGVGKSAVVQRFLREAEEVGTLVLRGRCYECEELPYKAFDPLIDALSNHLIGLDDADVETLLPPDIVCLTELFPVLGRVRAIADKGLVSAIGDPFERKRRAATACRRLLQRIAAKRQLVLYVDDLQWGDQDSGPLFADLLRGPDAPPMLLLFAFRAEDAQRCALIGALREDYLPSAGVSGRELCITALATADAERLAEALLFGTAEAAGAIRAIVAEACGSPFFIRELACFVRARGMDSATTLKLESALKARFDALPEHSRTLLEFVAAAGRPEPYALLSEASGLGRRCFAAAQVLKAHNMVHSSGAQEHARLEAYHDRIRESVYGQLNADRRRYLHRVLAVTLEQFAERDAQERDAEALCDHWRQAGERKRAFEYAIMAAEQAEASLAFLHAAKLYGKAIELVDHDLVRQSELEARIGKALMFAGRGTSAADALFRAIAHAPDEQAQDYRRMAITALLNAGSLDRAFAELRNAEDVLGLRFPATNLKAIGMLVWRRLRTKLNDQSLAPQLRDQPSAPLSQRLDNLYKVSTALSTVDFLRGGVYTAEHTLRALEHGHLVHVAQALSIESIRSAGPNKHPKQTQWIIDRGMQLAQKSGDAYALAVVTGTTGVSRYLEGRFEEAIRLTRESQRIHREQLSATMAWDIATMTFFELRATSQVGRVSEIVARVPDVLRDAEARGDLYSSTLFRVSRLCWAWLGVGDVEQAREQIATAQRKWVQEPYQLVHYYMLQAAGETALYQGKAEDVWPRAQAERKQMGLVTKIQFTRVEMLYLHARLALQIARARGEPSLVREAIKCGKALAAEPAAWAQLLGRLVLGCAALREAPAHAMAALQPLPAQLEAHDMLLPAAALRYRLGQLAHTAEGQAVADRAWSTIAAFGVANPEAFVEMLVPRP